jgi:hypothetical protein
MATRPIEDPGPDASLLESPQSGASHPQGYFWFWHFSDIQTAKLNFCFQSLCHAATKPRIPERIARPRA